MIVDFKRCGGLLTIPRGGGVTILRAAGLRSYTRFVGFRLGLATIIHAASDCRGIYPLSLPLIE